ncbi:hypothetical protein BW261_12930 [Klebsiella aerogenes]|uniref:hypothetical protein n=1 Tax=Klebsiella aerogenes TaxID=548 RepID=UPI000980B7BA|nr:hypothetical protein BW261_12930 [Klebsiella aerogenes]
MNNELTAALLTIEKCREMTNCPAGVDLQDWVKQLAAENVGLKQFCKNAAFDADYEAELGMERGGFTDALNDIETPATDRIVAGIKADGVEEWVSSKCGRWNGTTEEALKFAAQLRKGAAE